MTEDPYKVLGVPPTASDDEIQKAYRKMVKKYHPDVNPGDETAEKKMREINAAYDQIRNIREGKTTFGGQAEVRIPAAMEAQEAAIMAVFHGRIYSEAALKAMGRLSRRLLRSLLPREITLTQHITEKPLTF